MPNAQPRITIVGSANHVTGFSMRLTLQMTAIGRSGLFASPGCSGFEPPTGLCPRLRAKTLCRAAAGRFFAASEAVTKQRPKGKHG